MDNSTKFQKSSSFPYIYDNILLCYYYYLLLDKFVMRTMVERKVKSEVLVQSFILDTIYKFCHQSINETLDLL